MSTVVWRIATDTPTYLADDLMGAGAKSTGGRWNDKGLAMIYASETRALACLETIVHLNAGALPLNRYLVSIDIPDAIWAKARRETASALAVGWDAEPAGKVSIDFGTRWLKASTTALLVAPSVIVPEEFNVLINPSHADTKSLTTIKVRKWTYDPRFRKRPLTTGMRRDGADGITAPFRHRPHRTSFGEGHPVEKGSAPPCRPAAEPALKGTADPNPS